MGFFAPSLTNHLRLYAFRRPHLSTLLCSLSPTLFHSLLGLSFWDIVIFLVSVAAEILGVRLISMRLCYILIFLNWVPRFCKVSCFFVFGYIAMTLMHVCMNVKLKRLKIIYGVLAFSLLNLQVKEETKAHL